MDIYDKILQSLPRIVSKAWLVNRFIQDEKGGVRPKITPKYFGFLVLDQKKNIIAFNGKFMRIKKIKLIIPLELIEEASVHMFSNLRIKWRGKKGIKYNAVFQIGELDTLGIAYPSRKAAEVWSILINRKISKKYKKKSK